MKPFLKTISYRRLICNSRHFTNTFRRASSLSSTHATYEYLDEVEDLHRYAVGGFHPVRIGDCYHDRYRIVHKLGHGAHATIWLARDKRLMRYVALKIGVADCQTNEAYILSALAKCSHFPLLLDQFNVDGPNGTHKCLVVDPARCSLAACKEASWIRLFPLKTARVLCAQMAIAVYELHNKGYIHNGKRISVAMSRLPLTRGQIFTWAMFSCSFRIALTHAVKSNYMTNLIDQMPKQCCVKINPPFHPMCPCSSTKLSGWACRPKASPFSTQRCCCQTLARLLSRMKNHARTILQSIFGRQKLCSSPTVLSAMPLTSGVWHV